MDNYPFDPRVVKTVSVPPSQRRSSLVTPHQNERGASVTALFAAVMVVLVMAVGLVVDGGAQTAAKSRAETVAAEAARAGSAANASASIQGGSPDTSARAAAQRVLDARGMQGTITVSGGRITVTTQTSTPTTFLSLAGINQLSARGSASALLVES